MDARVGADADGLAQTFDKISSGAPSASARSATFSAPSPSGRMRSPCASSPPSSAPATSSPSATWTPATGRPRSPAARSSATRCSSSRSSPTSWRSSCSRSARGSPSRTGRDLAQACRDAFPRPVALALWVLAELAICATDLAEVIGTAIGLNLLFGIPLEIGVIITALDVFLVLWLQNLGFRWIEAFIITLLAVITVCFGVQIALARPEWGEVHRRLRADGGDRHQPRHALSRARHPRRDRDAAQPLPPLGDRADARLRRACRRETRGDEASPRSIRPSR